MIKQYDLVTFGSGFNTGDGIVVSVSEDKDTALVLWYDSPETLDEIPVRNLRPRKPGSKYLHVLIAAILRLEISQNISDKVVFDFVEKLQGEVDLQKRKSDMKDLIATKSDQFTHGELRELFVDILAEKNAGPLPTEPDQVEKEEDDPCDCWYCKDRY